MKENEKCIASFEFRIQFHAENIYTFFSANYLVKQTAAKNSNGGYNVSQNIQNTFIKASYFKDTFNSKPNRPIT